MRLLSSAAIAAFALGSLTSCASIVSDKSFPVSINSSPPGAKVEVIDKRGTTRFSGITPATAILDSGDGYFGRGRYSVKVSAPGYSEHVSQVNASFNPWYIGNIVFGGLIGFLIVDPITGAMYEIDNTIVNASLNPQIVSTPLSQTAPAIIIPAAQASTSQVIANSNNGEVLQKLNDLKKLKESGILTEAEYQKKRRELVDSL